MYAIVQKVVGSVESIGKNLLVAGRMPFALDLGGLCSTHVTFNRQACRILEADGHDALAQFLEAYREDLDLGVCWPDSGLGLGCVHHFYHAETGLGLLGQTPADVFCRRYFLSALKFWRQGNYRKAIFLLGAAIHFIQDLCEPHHTSCYVGMGHRSYEDWVAKNKNNYLVGKEGIYWNYQEPDRWLKECARKSYELLDLVTEKSSVDDYHQATEYLLPLAQRVTAGFIYNFFREAGMDFQQFASLEMLIAG